MKSRLLLSLLALLILLSTMNKGHCQEYIRYQVQTNSDNSAEWTITRVSDINDTIDTWESFQQKIFTLVNAAINATKREMAIEPESIQMETIISWEIQSKTTEYRFKWLNFSTMENGKIVFGDVFQVPAFFSQLYDDGALQFTYPSDYTVISVSPTPNNQDDNLQTLEWYRTQDFIKSKINITLSLKSQSEVSWSQSILIASVSAIAIAVSLIGVYLVRRNKTKAKRVSNAATFAEAKLTESDEEKIIKTIRSSGGSLNQTAIAEQCRFSKAKTSQLLATLEQKGTIKRFKKGRGKIVTLTEKQNKR